MRYIHLMGLLVSDIRACTLCVVFLLLALNNGYGQSTSNHIDSLMQLVEQSDAPHQVFYIAQIVRGKTYDLSLDSLVDVAIEAANSTKNDSIMGQAWRTKASLFHHNWKVDQAIPHWKKAYSYFKRSKSYNRQIATLSRISWSYMQKNNYIKADSFLKDGIALNESVSLSNRAKYTLHQALATTYVQPHQLMKAVEHHLNSIKYADTSAYGRMAAFHNNLGNLYKRMRRYEDAKSEYENSLYYGYKDRKRLGMNSYAFDGLSTTHALLGNNDSSSMFLDSAILYTKTLNNPLKLGILYNQKASALLETEDYKQAKSFAHLASETYEEKAHTSARIYNNLVLGYAHIGLEEYDKAVNICKKTLDIFDYSVDIKLYRNACFCLTSAYEGIGEYEKALEYSNKRYIAQDSAQNYINERAIAQLEAKYEIEKQKTIQAADAEKIQVEHQLEIQRQKSNRKYLLGGLAGVCLISFFLFRSNRRRKQINSLLKDKQEITESSLEEKDTLLREIHHRVKNNLQVISSLLFIQAQNFENEEVKQAIDQSRNRVRSMALIHQNLYQKENLSGVPVRTYFVKLIQELFETYQIGDSQIRLETIIDDIDLDVETMVPIGLVCNELISNALKHGFPNGRSGKLSVTIQEEENTLLIQIADDGVGGSMEKIKSSDSMGQRLVELFCKKLDADLDYLFEGGTQVTMKINQYKKTK